MRITNIRERLKNLLRTQGPAHKHPLAAAVVTGGLLFSGTASDAANLIVNGGFELPDTGWTNQGGDYTHPYAGINGPQLTEVGTLNDYGFQNNISANAGTNFHGLSWPTTQTQSLVNANLTAGQIAAGDGRFAFSSWLAACCNDVPKVTATFDDAANTTVSLNRGIAANMSTTADILVNQGGENNDASLGVETDASRRYWALYEFRGLIPSDATQITIAVTDGRADAATAGSETGGNGNDNYADMMIFDAVFSTESVSLELIVDKGTGELKIQNDAFSADDLNFYEIISTGNSSTLNPNWNSLADQMADSLGANPEDNWQEGGGSNPNLLTEAFLLGTTNLNNNGEFVSMANGYTGGANGPEDLVFRYGLAGGTMLTGAVKYTFTEPTDIAGDYNNNGQVEQADLDLVLLNWGNDVPPVPAGWDNPTYQPTAPQIDQDDLDGVLLNWGNSAANAAAVPEPTSLILIASMSGLLLVTRRRSKNS